MINKNEIIEIIKESFFIKPSNRREYQSIVLYVGKA